MTKPGMKLTAVNLYQAAQWLEKQNFVQGDPEIFAETLDDWMQQEGTVPFGGFPSCHPLEFDEDFKDYCERSGILKGVEALFEHFATANKHVWVIE